MVDELVDAGVVGADVRLGELPKPIAGGIGGRCEDALCPSVAGSHGRQTQLDGNRLKSSQLGEEKDGASAVGFSPVVRIDPIEEGEVHIMVVQYEQLLLVQGLFADVT